MHEQYILFGAPGTGKSHIIDKRLERVPEDKVFRVTIHQEYMYTDFVGQLLPQKKNDELKFEFVTGPFTDALKEAFADKDKNVYLVLEEISRGNVAAIFGDIFQLLDRNDHFESKYKIRNKDIASKIKEIPDDIIYLPSNFNILCTVNLNDQNVSPMDTAFKRRFDWEYVSTAPAKDENGVTKTKLNNPKIVLFNNSEDGLAETNWQSLYMALNEFILDREKGLGKKEDKQIGQFFIKYSDKTIRDSYSSDSDVSNKALLKVNTVLKNKLLMYLWQDIENHDIFSQSKLFNAKITSYDSLYEGFGNKNVFSEVFMTEFLLPGINKYPY